MCNFRLDFDLPLKIRFINGGAAGGNLNLFCKQVALVTCLQHFIKPVFRALPHLRLFFAKEVFMKAGLGDAIRPPDCSRRRIFCGLLSNCQAIVRSGIRNFRADKLKSGTSLLAYRHLGLLSCRTLSERGHAD